MFMLFCVYEFLYACICLWWVLFAFMILVCFTFKPLLHLEFILRVESRLFYFFKCLFKWTWHNILKTHPPLIWNTAFNWESLEIWFILKCLGLLLHFYFDYK